MSFFKRLTVRAKLYLFVAVFATLFIGFSCWTYDTLRIAKVEGPYYQRIVQGKDLIADILPPPNYIIESYLTSLEMTDEVEAGTDQATLTALVERCKTLKSEFDDRHAYWVSNLSEGEMKQVKIKDCYKPAIAFYDVMFDQFIPACFAGDKETSKSLSRGAMKTYYEQHRAAIDRVVAMATQQAVADEAEVTAIVGRRTSFSFAASFIVVGLAALVGWYTARETVGPLRGSATRLQFLSTNDLTSVSKRLRENAETTSAQATMASGAAEEVSANAQALAAAVEQFEDSIKEIATNSTAAADIARQAVEATDETNTSIAKLGESSSEIGNVIKVINSIAEQTNLLALNATIEAARAGEAGKGFAVVANEVKELAKETSKATEEIIDRIGSIQAGTEDAVSAIGRVGEVISQISKNQTAIAGAVEEQTAMTSEISRNISEVAIGSGEIARNISMVAETANNTTTSSDETLATAADIEAMADELMQLVGKTSIASGRSKSTVTKKLAKPGGKYCLPTADTSIAKLS